MAQDRLFDDANRPGKGRLNLFFLSFYFKVNYKVIGLQALQVCTFTGLLLKIFQGSVGFSVQQALPIDRGI
jgi:hypothetical protein